MKKKKTKAQLEEEKRAERLKEKSSQLKRFLSKIQNGLMTDEDIRHLAEMLKIEDYNELQGSYNDIIVAGFPYSDDLRTILYHYLDSVLKQGLIDGGLVMNMLSHGYISRETFLILHDNAKKIRESGFGMVLHPMLKKMLERNVKANPRDETDLLPLTDDERKNFRLLIDDYSPEMMQLTLEEMAMATQE